MDSTVWELAKNRLLWLLILMVSATITASLINRYNRLLEGMVVLTAFIPMLMDTGGNSGNQASTLMVRGLAVGEVTFRDWGRVLWKELRVGLLCASILASINFLRIAIFKQALWPVNLVVNLTLFLTVVVAKVLGSSLPIAAKLARLDPALMASPILTTMVDLFTLLIYFLIATHLLPVLGFYPANAPLP